MGETKHVCNHCGGNSLWRGFVDGVKRVFKFKRQEDRLMYVPVEKVDQNPYQPREYVVEEPLESLRKSIAVVQSRVAHQEIASIRALDDAMVVSILGKDLEKRAADRDRAETDRRVAVRTVHALRGKHLLAGRLGDLVGVGEDQACKGGSGLRRDTPERPDPAPAEAREASRS